MKHLIFVCIVPFLLCGEPVTFRSVALWHSSTEMAPYAQRMEIPLFLSASPLTLFHFGNFANPVEAKLGLVAGVTVGLWRGAEAELQYAFPFYNEFDTNLTPSVQLLVLRQLIAHDQRHYWLVSSGFFRDQRWGVSAEWLFRCKNQRFALGLTSAVTGLADRESGHFYYSSLGKVTAEGTLLATIPRYNLIVRPFAGYYLGGDFGGGVEVTRYFGSVAIGFHGLYTERGHNGGVSLSVPLWPSRPYPQRGPVAVGPAPSFDWRYRYRRYEEPGMGVRSGFSLHNVYQKDAAKMDRRVRCKREKL